MFSNPSKVYYLLFTLVWVCSSVCVSYVTTIMRNCVTLGDLYPDVRLSSEVETIIMTKGGVKVGG